MQFPHQPSDTEDGVEDLAKIQYGEITCQSVAWEEEPDPNNAKCRVDNIHPHGIDLLPKTFEHIIGNGIQIHHHHQGGKVTDIGSRLGLVIDQIAQGIGKAIEQHRNADAKGQGRFPHPPKDPS